MSDFKDHFSKQSRGYSKYRPQYPAELYRFLSDISKSHDLAWDCATGTGQAARGLASFFEHVVATDGSNAQLRQASGPENISFRLATAENSGLVSKTVDLIAVAQALHWFDLDLFYEEAKRVLKPEGIIAIWSYNLLRINDKIDAILLEFNEDIVGAYWPPERQLVNENYRDMPFPFQDIAPSDAGQTFQMTALWSLNDLLGYLATWSSVVRYKADRKRDPLKEIHGPLKDAWHNNAPLKKITWPLTLKVGKC